jgi:molecular chaperone GrpE
MQHAETEFRLKKKTDFSIRTVMSKNKEKPWSPMAPPEAGKHQTHEGAAGGNRPAHHSPLGEGGTTAPASPAGYAGQAPEDGLPTAAPGAKAGQPTAPAEAAGQTEQLARLQDRLLRLQADFDNFRKRTLREKNELFDSANQALMLELLPVLDHLHLGIQATTAHEADPAFREGLVLILDQLMGVLSKFGLSPMASEKQVFDPNRFEAVNALHPQPSRKGL